MNHARWGTPILMTIAFLGAVLLGAGAGAGARAGADDPPPAARAKGKGKGKSQANTNASGKAASKKASRGDDPPPCEHMIPPVANGPQTRPSRNMEEMFNGMMDRMAKNPAGGFADVMKDQERAALGEITLSPLEERRIGLKARDEFLRLAGLQDHPVVNSPARLKYLRDLVASLAGRMKNRARYPDVDVTIIDVPIPDGQSFPGGFLVFTSALLDEPDEATVAGVVAHELAHLDRGHLYEYAKREKLAESAFRPDSPAGMPRPDQFLARGMALGSLMMNPFRPEHEHEADCVATTWLYQEGYDPRGLSRFLERMNRRNRDQPDPPFFQIARSHPNPLDRRDAVLERLAQLQRWKTRDDLKLYADNLRRLSPKPPGR